MSTKTETRTWGGCASASGTMTRLQCCRRAMQTALMLARPCRQAGALAQVPGLAACRPVLQGLQTQRKLRLSRDAEQLSQAHLQLDVLLGGEGPQLELYPHMLAQHDLHGQGFEISTPSRAGLEAWLYLAQLPQLSCRFRALTLASASCLRAAE